VIVRAELKGGLFGELWRDEPGVSGLEFEVQGLKFGVEASGDPQSWLSGPGFESGFRVSGFVFGV